jgi:hypothetical protein
VEEEYAVKESEFNAEKEAKLAEAKAKEESLAPQVAAKQAELNEANNALKQQLAEAKATYQQESKEAKIKHKAIEKEEIAKIEKMYKDMWEKEKAEYRDSMAKNKDAESRRSRRLSYSVFKESFPQMKANDLERKTNSLEFDKETELNGLKARYTQQKTLLTDNIKENNRKFKEDNFPYQVLVKEYDKKTKELLSKKKDDLLHAQLIFFFKYDEVYQLIPDVITKKIIQGLGEKVFTKIFRIEAPHDGFVEEEGGLPFKVVALINYGDVKLYKCTGSIFGEKVVVYINKERDIEIGSDIKLSPVLEKAQVYEDERNIRLY